MRIRKLKDIKHNSQQKKRKKNEKQMSPKTIHRKLKMEQHEPHENLIVSPCVSNTFVLTVLVTTRCWYIERRY